MKSKKNVDGIIALTQVKYLAECVKRLTNFQGLATNEDLPYGIPESSQVSCSQEEPIIINLDEDTEKTNSNKNTKEAEKRYQRKKANSNKFAKRTISDNNTTEAISDKAKGKILVQSSNMPKELDEMLRINKQDLVNSFIIPSIMNNINSNVFPITEEIIYGILHSLHRHRCEEYLRKNLLLIKKNFKEQESIRTSDKRKKRAKTIKYLQLIKDPLIKKFNDLQSIIDSNLYHSPEESETDPETEKNKIIVKDLKWRSLTLRSLLRDYIDQLRAKWSNNELADHSHDVANNVLFILSKIYDNEYDAHIEEEEMKKEEEKMEE
ncbi:hypothetical protein C1645_823070 [Glomus cerebriforme]|uniref:Uncharacterized protein n=1 Tax=Glomus cerebriforme TaxID=658196 RepID=A0A397SYF9_9GLOM|nr:hypothetical protein C1645_823070 [Glomus cerebriforme]